MTNRTRLARKRPPKNPKTSRNRKRRRKKSPRQKPKKLRKNPPKRSQRRSARKSPRENRKRNPNDGSVDHLSFSTAPGSTRGFAHEQDSSPQRHAGHSPRRRTPVAGGRAHRARGRGALS